MTKVRCLHAWYAISGVCCGGTEGAGKVNWPPTFNDSRPAKRVRRQSTQHRLAQAEKQSVKFNCQQISMQNQLSASVIGQVVAGARLVSRGHRSISRTFASLALEAPIAVWMPNNVCQRRSGRKSVMSRVYSVANWTEFRRTPKRKRKPGVTLGGIIHRGRNRSRFVEKIWLRRTHISFSGRTPLISDRALNIPITLTCP